MMDFGFSARIWIWEGEERVCIETYHADGTSRQHETSTPGQAWALLCQLLFAGYAIVLERENVTKSLKVFIAVKSGAVDVVMEGE